MTLYIIVYGVELYFRFQCGLCFSFTYGVSGHLIVCCSSLRPTWQTQRLMAGFCGNTVGHSVCLRQTGHFMNDLVAFTTQLLLQ
jgi:hypothetical protein